jgi:hypothetical protein
MTTTPSRSELLTSYLSDNQVWHDLVGAYQDVFGNDFDRNVLELAKLRDFLQLEKGTVVGTKLLDYDNLTLPDAGVLVRTCGMLGFGYPNYDSSLFSDEDYLRILQSLSQYYQQQGTQSFFQFLSFVLNAYYAIEPLWTQDYVNFSSRPQGPTVWEGGSWYPTSHVQIILDDNQPQASLGRMRLLFDYIAPINLVLWSIALRVPADMACNVVMTGNIFVLQRNL